MSSKFLKVFFTTFFDTFNDNKPRVNKKSVSTYKPSGIVYELVSEKVLMGFVGALDTALKAHLDTRKSKLFSRSSPAPYYVQNRQGSSALSGGGSLLKDLSQFYASTAKKREGLPDPLTERPLTLQEKVSALLVKLKGIELSDEIEQKDAAVSSSRTRTSSEDFSDLADLDWELSSIGKVIAFGDFILKELAEMEKKPTSAFGTNTSEVIMKYSQELLAKLKEKENVLYPVADKKSCLIM